MKSHPELSVRKQEKEKRNVWEAGEQSFYVLRLGYVAETRGKGQTSLTARRRGREEKEK